MKELHPWDVYLSKRAHDIPWPAFFEAKFRRCTDKEVRFFFLREKCWAPVAGYLTLRNGEVVYFRFISHQQNLT